MRKALCTSKNVPRPPIFYDFDFQIALTRKHGTNFAELNFQKYPEPSNFLIILILKSLSRTSTVQILRNLTTKSVPNLPIFDDLDCKIVFVCRHGTIFYEIQFQKIPQICQYLTILTSKSLSRAGVVQILLISWATDPPQLPFFGIDFANPRSHEIDSRICVIKYLCYQLSMLQNPAAIFNIIGN